MFYVSGFDPKGAAHYHRLYAEEAPKSAQVGGYRVQVGKRRKAGEHAAAWSVEWDGPGPSGTGTETVHTEIEFLRWDDIVRDHWPKHAGVLARDLVTTTWLYVRTGAMWKMLKLAWPPVVALVTPFLVLLALALAFPLSVLAGLGLWSAGLPAWAALPAVPVLCVAAFFLARMAERRMNMQWLLRSYAFTGRQGTHGWPALEARLDAFARRIVERVQAAERPGMPLPPVGEGRGGGAVPRTAEAPPLPLSGAGQGESAAPRRAENLPLPLSGAGQSESAAPRRAENLPLPLAGEGRGEGGPQSASNPCDEVLIVAHSSGSIMASIALSRALALDPELARRGPGLSLLTLGQWSPLLSSLPTAQGFRDELARLGAEPDLDWVDFTAPPDGCCFALTDPVTAAGLPRTRVDHPRLLSPRFAAMFGAAGYAAIKRDRFRLHFQYLMAAELAGEYDYTAITAGPLTLGARFAGHASTDGFARFRLFGS